MKMTKREILYYLDLLRELIDIDDIDTEEIINVLDMLINENKNALNDFFGED